MLYNLNKYLTTNTIKYFYYLLFKYLHLNSGNLVRSQNINTIKRLTIFQKKTLRKINFEPQLCSIFNYKHFKITSQNHPRKMYIDK